MTNFIDELPRPEKHFTLPSGFSVWSSIGTNAVTFAIGSETWLGPNLKPALYSPGVTLTNGDFSVHIDGKLHAESVEQADEQNERLVDEIRREQETISNMLDRMYKAVTR